MFGSRPNREARACNYVACFEDLLNSWNVFEKRKLDLCRTEIVSGKGDLDLSLLLLYTTNLHTLVFVAPKKACDGVTLIKSITLPEEHQMSSPRSL